MEKIDHNFKKKFGQNFLTDVNLLESIVKDAQIQEEDNVVEIGAGAGALTLALSKKAKKVLSFEIDKDLEKVLSQKLENTQNVKVVFDDFMNVDEEFIYENVGKNFKVVANLPYYITTAIISKLFEMQFSPQTIVVMVQKEVGERITSGEKSPEYSYFSAYVNAHANAKIVRNVNRKMFVPVPNVDSCIVRLDKKENSYEKAFFDFLKASFSMKRKTLVNNICACFSFSKQVAQQKIQEAGFEKSVRADSLSCDQLYQIYESFF